MSIRFQCPGCGKSYTVPNDAAGRSGTCKNCGGRFQVPAPATASTGAEISCPSCGKMIAATAKKCRFCGEQIQISCPSCGETIPAKAKKCHFCGEPLETASPPVASRRAAAPRGASRRETDAMDDDVEAYAPRRAPARRRAPHGHCPKDEWDKNILDYLTEYCGGKLLETKGRATRREFWTCFLAGLPFVMLVTYLTMAAIGALLVTFFGMDAIARWSFRHSRQINFFLLLPLVPMAVPFATLCARRWQDAGINGTVGFIPIGWLGVFCILLIGVNNLDEDFLRVCLFLTAVALAAIVACGLLPGKEGRNAYGADRYDPDEEDFYDDDDAPRGRGRG